MVGIPKSNRCKQCKARKIKCDEAWPRCGPCTRSRHACSGPPSLTKFVHNGRHATPQSSSSSSDDEGTSADAAVAVPQLPGAASGSIVSVHCRTMRGGSQFREMRICSTFDEQLAIRLITMRDEHLDTRYDAAYRTYFLNYVPQRIGHSLALQDSVDCFLASWENCRRGLPMHQILSKSLYGKALRSLQTALSDPKEQYSTGTFTAAAVLCKLDQTWAVNRSANRNAHSNGLNSLVEIMGPPSIDDELAVVLSLELAPQLISTSIVSNTSSFYMKPEWQKLWSDALEAGTLKGSDMEKNYILLRAIAAWPSLKRDLLNLLQSPPEDGTFICQAETLFFGLTAWLMHLQDFDQVQLEGYRQKGAIKEVASPNPLLPEIFEFSDHGAARMLVDHAMLTVIFTTMAVEVSLLLGCYDDSFERTRYKMSQRIWKSLKHFQNLRPLAGVCILVPLVMTFESADEQMRDWILDQVCTFDRYSGWLCKEPWVFDCIYSSIRAATGRLPFLPTQDISVEVKGLGARS